MRIPIDGGFVTEIGDVSDMSKDKSWPHKQRFVFYYTIKYPSSLISVRVLADSLTEAYKLQWEIKKGNLP